MMATSLRRAADWQPVRSERDDRVKMPEMGKVPEMGKIPEMGKMPEMGKIPKIPKMLSVGLGILTASVVGAGMDVGADIEGVSG
jgi:hypothetical protein